ncbi:uncharacterized protein BO97DRAFT_416863 [Aspergillus homomorphus CBS 101889]|uniref:Nephrocystin 3-like N-terminal domain-containing protein n=1 Tax=Aspergillus homomorphus (strain CBS 101889) TaxID=1450537 RepID=A0A395HQ17_ASPHC|nr:hypothetical protein BO97DRAFT_416863 [Aspergillus homomorphus CBS 101889]RAL09365.1 hypothetical protein BO97DRAFT_416863 [Aspergillus homomorphus CBS 101889]
MHYLQLSPFSVFGLFLRPTQSERLTMAESKQLQLDGESMAVAFVKNRLPASHPMFDYYNRTVGEEIAEDEGEEDDAPSRPAFTQARTMTFWANLFPQAMAKFNQSSPSRQREQKTYTIRDKADWDSVVDTLEAARDHYQPTEISGHKWGWRSWTRARRRAADHVEPVAEVVRTAAAVAPSNPYSTPVLASLGIILQAVKASSNVRTRTLEGLKDLIPVFSEAELFLSTFPKDDYINKASLDLAVATLDAIDRAITFFSSNEFFRGVKAILAGGQYESALLKSLDQIQNKSQTLNEEARKSYSHENHIAIQQSRQRDKGNKAFQAIVTNGIKKIQDLMAEHMMQMESDRLRAESDLQRKNDELEAAREEIRYLQSRKGWLHGDFLDVIPLEDRLSRPHTPTVPTYLSLVTLRRMLGVPELDQFDMHSVANLRGRLPEKEQAQAEQALHTAEFHQWLVAPASCQLLAVCDRPAATTQVGVSALSVLACTITQAMQAQPRFIALVFFAGRQAERVSVGEGEASGGPTALVRCLIDQLLRQHDYDLRRQALAGDVMGSLDEQIELLESLVRQLPFTRTLCCLIDGVVLLERDDEYAAAALPVLLRLIKLVHDPSVRAPLKLLFTSTPGPTFIRKAFVSPEEVLNVRALASHGQIPSDERVARELGEAFYEEEQW